MLAAASREVTRIRDLEERAGPLPELGHVLVGNADHLRDDDAGEDCRELVLKLALAAFGDLVDQRARRDADVGFHLGDTFGSERTRHERAQRGVARRVHVDHLRQQVVGFGDDARERVEVVHRAPHVVEAAQHVLVLVYVVEHGVLVAQDPVDVPDVALELQGRRVVVERSRRRHRRCNSRVIAPWHATT